MRKQLDSASKMTSRVFAEHYKETLELIKRCENGPWRQMLAVIGDSANAGSIGLHGSQGFRQIGRLDSVGFKFGRWVDSILMQRPLGKGSLALP